MLHLPTFGPPLALIDLVRSHSDLGAEDRVVTPNLVGRRARCSLQPRPEEHKTTSFGHAYRVMRSASAVKNPSLRGGFAPRAVGADHSMVLASHLRQVGLKFVCAADVLTINEDLWR